MRTGCQWLLSLLRTYRGWSDPLRSLWLRGVLFAYCFFFVQSPGLKAEEIAAGTSSRQAKSAATRGIPYARIKKPVAQRIQDVVEHPSFFRRMPTEEIECDPDLFTFMVRRPEVMVNIWQVMGITQVTARRLDDYSFVGNDGAGTICRCELVYASRNLHVYFGDGSYDGSMAPRKVTGRCVCVLRTEPFQGKDGEERVRGTMDVFMKLDNFGADLLARSVAPFIGKTADYNFVETARFIAQISSVCKRSPVAAKNLASQLDSVQAITRSEFSKVAGAISLRNRAAEALGYSPSGRSQQTPMSAPAQRAAVQNNKTQNVIAGAESGSNVASPFSTARTDREPHAPIVSWRPSQEMSSSSLTDSVPQRIESNFGGNASLPESSPPATMQSRIRPQKKNIFLRR